MARPMDPPYRRTPPCRERLPLWKPYDSLLLNAINVTETIRSQTSKVTNGRARVHPFSTQTSTQERADSLEKQKQLAAWICSLTTKGQPP
jgi:hypothetical protein